MATVLAENGAPLFAGFQCFPEMMLVPQVLYRSISLLELIDIHMIGAVIGGGNRFNPFDERLDVFFADEIDDRLIRQGEYVDRQIEYAMRASAEVEAVKQADELVEGEAAVILIEMDHDRIRYPSDYVDDFKIGMEQRRFRRAVFRCPTACRPKYCALFRSLAQAVKERDTCSENYEAAFQRRYVEREQWLAAQPFSSAILVTHPISGGRIYSAETGCCGHGEREYGFPSGKITIDDIAEIILIKDCREVERCPVALVDDRLQLIEPVAGEPKRKARNLRDAIRLGDSMG